MAEPLSNRPAGKRETREALIQAGIAELAAKGLQEPSLDAICARAGYTRGAFYVHFEDREDFVAAVMERVLSGFLDAVIDPGSGEHDLADTLAGFAGALPGAGRAIQLHRLIEACARSPRIRERWVALVREATLRVAKAVERGTGRGRACAPTSRPSRSQRCWSASRSARSRRSSPVCPSTPRGPATRCSRC